MQLFSIQSKSLWILLPSLALAATPPAGGSTSAGSGQLQLTTPQHLNDSRSNRIMYCRHNIPDPDDPDWPPYEYKNSLNRTITAGAPPSQSFLESVGFVRDSGSVAFDCFLDIPPGAVTFEVRGEIDSSLRVAYAVYLSVLALTWQIGQFECDLLDVEEKPCVFGIDKKYVKGQGQLFSQVDPADPDMIDICVKIEGSIKLPFTRTKGFHFEDCFFKFHKH